MLGSGFCKAMLPCDPEWLMECWEVGCSSGLGFWEGGLPSPVATCVGRRQCLQLWTNEGFVQANTRVML